ncbi:amidase family protein [Burkholderia ambifaria]|uniref:amidase family protein n=1 Tax=Burkholderia ambifaria TaxID=152480 RepID=UPI0012FDBD57
MHQLRRAEAVFLGLTSTPEFGWKAVTDSPRSGSTINPWNPALTAGGSSGGAAVVRRNEGHIWIQGLSLWRTAVHV